MKTLCVSLAIGMTFVAMAEQMCLEGDYRPLRVVRGALRPFAEQHNVDILPVQWWDPHGRDLLACGTEFANKNVIHRFLRLEHGIPVYDSGTPYSGPGPRGAERVALARGGFDLYLHEAQKGAAGPRRDFLCRHRCEVANGRLVSASGPVRVPETGTTKDFELNGVGDMSLVDLDGDGIDDLICSHRYMYDADRLFPWTKDGPWRGGESAFAGYGRGYDIFGRWLGVEAVAMVKWAKGARSKDGSLSFSAFRPVLSATPDFPDLRKPLTWKQTFVIIGMNVLEAKSGRYLVLVGDIDKLVALPLTVSSDDVFCGEPRPLLADGYVMPHSYHIRHLRKLDVDLDGKPEFLLDGNPGTVAVLKGTEPGTFRSARAMIEGGDVCGETLSSPARTDWDGDGLPDLILGDATGWVTFWGGTRDPYVYKGPRPFVCNGERVKVQPGPSGSIQGYGEYRWGYVTVIAGCWGGRDVLITVDASGALLLHERDEKKGALALKPARSFRRKDGTPYRVAWRSRPDFVRSATGFAGVPRDSLVLQDLQGDLAVAVPESDGALTIAETRKLRDENGSPLHLCGINGHWGRGHCALADWDGDGRLDLVFGTLADCVRTFRPDLKLAATPFVFRNVGTNANPSFSRGEPLALRRNGKRLNFGWHVSTPWITDLDGDGRPDLLVGAENGKVYAFRNDELRIGGSNQ